MDMSKFREIFNPQKLRETVHIIGCGSVGSTIAELLARYGITNIVLYDFDVVEPKNIANQMFFDSDIGRLKVDAVEDLIIKINPDAKGKVRKEPDGYKGQKLNGYVFLAVDSIDLRREIATKEKFSTYIKAMFDIRTGLYDAQHYAADWRSFKEKENLIKSMNFSSSDVKEKVSACGVTFGVAPTVRMVCNIAVANFINFVTERKIKNTIIVNPFDFENDTTVVVL